MFPVLNRVRKAPDVAPEIRSAARPSARSGSGPGERALGWIRTSGLDVRNVALFPLSYKGRRGDTMRPLSGMLCGRRDSNPLSHGHLLYRQARLSRVGAPA